jgi:hypothetical protein
MKDDNNLYDEEQDKQEEESQNSQDTSKGQTAKTDESEFETLVIPIIQSLQSLLPQEPETPEPETPEPEQHIQLKPSWRQKLRERTEAAVKGRAEEKIKEEQRDQEWQERKIAAELEALKSDRELKQPLKKIPSLTHSLLHTPYEDIYTKFRNTFNRIPERLIEQYGGSCTTAAYVTEQKKLYWRVVQQCNEWRRFLFSEEFTVFRERDFMPKKWMLRDETIKRRLEDRNDLDFQRLKTILNHLWRNILNQQACIDLTDKIGAERLPKIETRTKRDRHRSGLIIKGGEKEEVPVKRDYVFVAPLDFEAIQKQYGKGYSEGYVKQYMDAAARTGILKRFDRRTGPRGQTVYAIGYWAPAMGKGTFKAQPFLQDNEKFRMVLRKFRLLETETVEKGKRDEQKGDKGQKR